MNQRIRRLNFLAITIVILYTVLVLKFISTRTVFSPLIDPVAVFLTSIGFYQILIDVLYRVICYSKTALKLYWGREFLDGLWYYIYFREGEGVDPNKIYFGVWHFEQDLFLTKAFGMGLTDGFVVRSRVRSITDLMEVNGMYEIFGVRTDNASPDRDFYSRSSMVFDENRNSWLNYPLKIRGKTIIYGGVLTGSIHVDEYVKCPTAKTEDDAIAILKERLKTMVPNANT